ncbi:hypothetical protein MLD38_001140 [Melastoma candidum]|uniref:Uncharacterized protein n=1 Tax=Melastoma candidum TaxID=119954 RepID=A0ACB9SDL6_9MYRT|nr:hypothetical protein MLD38_001140 [Melastoma candidum]
MSAISHLAPAKCSRRVRLRFPKSDAFASGDAGCVAFQGDRLRISRLGLSTEKTAASRCPTICTALVDERLAPGRKAAKPPGVLAYDLVQGALVRWSIIKDKSMPEPPTAVLLHGILGSRKNWAQEFPTWQFLLVDLRCHGDSATMKKQGPHTVSAMALDVLKLLRLTPRILIGHSFGGKVAMSMVEQAAKPLARPVQVWVLDSTPGKVRPGGHKDDHPAELIGFLNSLPMEVDSKRDVIGALVHEGFSREVAKWVATNFRPASNS